MQTAKIWLRRILIGFCALAVVVAICIGFAAWRFNQVMTINAPDGIEEAGYVRIGGIDQWVQVRGQDRANPVLLWLNGGPGASTIPQTYFYREWEKHFTVVMWDQRGEGKTFDRTGASVAPTMTINRMTQDALELSKYLRARFHKKKIVLLGHSWGSILGVHMVRERPEFFSAYVGTGQIQTPRKDAETTYPALLARAESQGAQQAIQELEGVGPPPYADDTKYVVSLKWANMLDPFPHPHFSAGGLWAMARSTPPMLSPGAQFSQRLMLNAILNEDLPSVLTDFRVPVFIIEGPEDLVTPEAKSYFDKMASPHKEFHLLPGTGHLAIFDADRFLEVLVKRVRPLVAQ